MSGKGNDKWKRSAPFISPVSGVKWGLAPTIFASSAGWYEFCSGFFCLFVCLGGGFAKRFTPGERQLSCKMIFRNNPKTSFIPVIPLDPQPNKQILRQRAFLFSLYQPPPLTPAKRKSINLMLSTVSRVKIPLRKHSKAAN